MVIMAGSANQNIAMFELLMRDSFLFSSKHLNPGQILCMACRSPGITCPNQIRGRDCTNCHSVERMERVECKELFCNAKWGCGPWLCPYWHANETADDYKTRLNIINPDSITYGKFTPESCMDNYRSLKNDVDNLRDNTHVNKRLISYTIMFLIHQMDFWKFLSKELRSIYNYKDYLNSEKFKTDKQPYDDRSPEEQARLRNMIRDDYINMREVELYDKLYNLFENREDERKYFDRFFKDLMYTVVGDEIEEDIAEIFRCSKLKEWGMLDDCEYDDDEFSR